VEDGRLRPKHVTDYVMTALKAGNVVDCVYWRLLFIAQIQKWREFKSKLPAWDFRLSQRCSLRF